ncbi:MAG: VOC family protein [Pseudolabrys sp.]|nr:VOC family protein [Pseudolabrys sp.]
MEVQALGYVGLPTAAIDDWADYGSKFLGMQLVDRTRGYLTFRMDDRRQRLVVSSDSADRSGFFGWEVADAKALNAMAARVEAAGVAVERLSAAVAGQRRVREAIAFKDPVGNRLEVFYGAEIAADPFVPGRSISGFRTGPLGMGHAVLHVERIDEALAFYTQVLGLRVSDFFTVPYRAYFFHVNPRHHSFAMIETGRNGIHHLMMELTMLDDVGQGYDLALGEKGRIATTLGRHINDQMVSFYARTPSDFFIEYGWGGRSIEPATWQPEEITYGASLWGHDRDWLGPEQSAAARALKLKAAADGLRAPVNVIDGNYAVAPGQCIWWDQMRKTG